MKPGDTIYVSGGSSSQTYNETLQVGASGSASGAVTITKGTDAGHNGEVVIDGGGSRYGVEINSRDYVTVSDLNVENINGTGFRVTNAHSGVVLEGNSVYSGDPGGGNARGYEVRNSVGDDAVIVRGNSFHTPASTKAQTDGIWSSGNNGVTFENNDITIENSDSTGHSDGIQSFQDTNITVTGNRFSHPNGGENNHGMWVTDIASGGRVSIYDNKVSMPVGDEIGIAHWNQNAGWTGTSEIWNNTIADSYKDPIYTPDPAYSNVHDNTILPSDSPWV